MGDSMFPLRDRRPFYSPGEVADLARVDSKTVLSWIHAGKLNAVQLSARIYRIPLAAVIKLLAPELIRRPTVRRRSVRGISRPTDPRLRARLRERGRAGTRA